MVFTRSRDPPIGERRRRRLILLLLPRRPLLIEELPGHGVAEFKRGQRPADELGYIAVREAEAALELLQAVFREVLRPGHRTPPSLPLAEGASAAIYIFIFVLPPISLGEARMLSL